MKFWLILMLLVLSPSISFSQKPLSQLNINSVQFADADLPSVLEFLSLKAREMKGQPSNFVIYDPSGKIAESDPKVSMNLSGVPFSTVIRYVTQLTGTAYQVDSKVVWIGSPTDLQTLRVRRSSRTSKALSSPVFQKLRQLPVAQIDFSKTSLLEAVDGIRQLERSKGGPGNYIVVGSNSVDPSETLINLKLANVSLADLVQFTSELSNFTLRADPRALILRAPDKRPHPLPISRSPILNYLASRPLEQVSVSEASLSEMIEYIQYHSQSPQLPSGINIVNFSASKKVVSLDLKQVRLIDVLRYTNEQTDTTFRFDHQTLQIVDLPSLPQTGEASQ